MKPITLIALFAAGSLFASGPVICTSASDQDTKVRVELISGLKSEPGSQREIRVMASPSKDGKEAARARFYDNMITIAFTSESSEPEIQITAEDSETGKGNGLELTLGADLKGPVTLRIDGFRYEGEVACKLSRE